jgi:hypothetical protein
MTVMASLSAIDSGVHGEFYTSLMPFTEAA